MLMEDFIKNNKNTAGGNYSFYCTTLCIVPIDLTKTFIDHCKDILNYLLLHCHVDCIKESKGKFPLLVFFTCFCDLIEAYHVLQLNLMFKMNFTSQKSYDSNATIRISGILMDNVKDRTVLTLVTLEDTNVLNDKLIVSSIEIVNPFTGLINLLQIEYPYALMKNPKATDIICRWPSSFKKNFNVKHLEKIINNKLLKEGGSINIKVISKNDRLFIINFIIEHIDSFTKIIQNSESFSLDDNSVYMININNQIKKLESILKKTNAINYLERKRDSEHFDNEIKKVRMTILEATRTEEELITSDTTIEEDYHYEGIKEMKKEVESDVE
ncbi:hypothetical protein ABK040_001522 [Willaertia magna]